MYGYFRVYSDSLHCRTFPTVRKKSAPLVIVSKDKKTPKFPSLPVEFESCWGEVFGEIKATKRKKSGITKSACKWITVHVLFIFYVKKNKSQLNKPEFQLRLLNDLYICSNTVPSIMCGGRSILYVNIKVALLLYTSNLAGNSLDYWRVSTTKGEKLVQL